MQNKYKSLYFKNNTNAIGVASNGIFFKLREMLIEDSNFLTGNLAWLIASLQAQLEEEAPGTASVLVSINVSKVILSILLVPLPGSLISEELIELLCETMDSLMVEVEEEEMKEILEHLVEESTRVTMH